MYTHVGIKAEKALLVSAPLACVVCVLLTLAESSIAGVTKGGVYAALALGARSAVLTRLTLS